MRLFQRNDTKVKRESYDAETLTPVIRASICTGEKTAGFREKETGKFHDIMLVRTDEDMLEFRTRYGIDGDIETIY
ncbi:MAG: aspartate dehydrogenase [Lachnospiraceae bacterium]|nr:aspartate dehydrogenase [Lachnospiraceae bacterium]